MDPTTVCPLGRDSQTGGSLQILFTSPVFPQCSPALGVCVCVCTWRGVWVPWQSSAPHHAQGSCKTQFRVFYLLPLHFSWDLNFLCSSENPSCSWGGRLRVGSPLDGGTCWGGHRRSSKGGQGLVTVTLVCSGLALGAGGEAPISL